jgi:segregation and condensation protein A
MEPTFHLEGVIKTKEEMQDFEGPLNLILMLLSKNKIEIRDIQISEILDQYLEFIAKMQELDLEVASEFVQMASNLLYIKTKTLLSGDEEVTELELLMTSLEQLKAKDTYAAIRAVTPDILSMSERGRMLCSTPGETLPKYGEYAYKHKPVELMEAIYAMFTRGTRKLPIRSRTKAASLLTCCGSAARSICRRFTVCAAAVRSLSQRLFPFWSCAA